MKTVNTQFYAIRTTYNALMFHDPTIAATVSNGRELITCPFDGDMARSHRDAALAMCEKLGILAKPDILPGAILENQEKRFEMVWIVSPELAVVQGWAKCEDWAVDIIDSYGVDPGVVALEKYLDDKLGAD